MTSYPLIQSELSETQHEFIDWVEQAMRMRGGADDTLRFAVTRTQNGDDVAERRHTIEFVERGTDGAEIASGRVSHSMKEIESAQGRYSFIESTFELSGANVPDLKAPYGDVERAVKVRLDRLKGRHRQPPVEVW